MTITDGFSELRNTLSAMVAEAESLPDLESARVAILGKKGIVTARMKDLAGMSPDERRTAGQALNALKDEIVSLIDSRERLLARAEMDIRLERERVDITLSARPAPRGHIHPISQTTQDLIRIFGAMGFDVAEGPDIENDWYNFTALNFPEGHPAREMQDTFFLPDDPDAPQGQQKKLLRTHTSPVQIRHMSTHKPPIRIISLGRVYRSDYDMTHTPVFHQMECLYIDKDVHMGHLKGCMTDFVRAYFEVEDLPVRFRPSFFPFVEPGAELDIGCLRENTPAGEQILKINKAENLADQDWLEVLGCGMVHPKVLANCGIDPDIYQGFAFGVGIERIAMLKYGIPDLRTFFEGDVRWLRHYGFEPLQG